MESPKKDLYLTNSEVSRECLETISVKAGCGRRDYLVDIGRPRGIVSLLRAFEIINTDNSGYSLREVVKPSEFARIEAGYNNLPFRYDYSRKPMRKKQFAKS